MTEPVRLGDATLYTGDVLSVLATMPDKSVHCVVTSPPYWGLRDYGTGTWEGGEPGCDHKNGSGAWATELEQQKKRADTGMPFREVCGKCGARRIDQQIGLEETPEQYVAKMVAVFREVRRVLRKDGTLWINIADSYIGGGRGGLGGVGHGSLEEDRYQSGQRIGKPTGRVDGYKAKDLVGIPEQFALALRADGWYWRSRIPWIKRNCMPESCRDRPATAVEYIMLFSKSGRYYYDREAVKMQSSGTAHARGDGVNPKAKVNHGRAGMGRFRPKQNESFSGAVNKVVPSRNRRNSDWFMESWQGLLADEDGEPLAFIVNTRGYKGAHFATFPPKLVLPMILAGCPIGGAVMDPFGGSGTTAEVALEYGRRAILIELKPEYVELAKRRLRPVAGRPMLNFAGEKDA